MKTGSAEIILVVHCDYVTLPCRDTELLCSCHQIWAVLFCHIVSIVWENLSAASHMTNTSCVSVRAFCARLPVAGCVCEVCDSVTC